MSPGWRQLTALRVINFTPLGWLARDSNWGACIIVVPHIITCCTFFPRVWITTAIRILQFTAPVKWTTYSSVFNRRGTEAQGSMTQYFLKGLWAGNRIDLCGHCPVKCNEESKSVKVFFQWPELHIAHNSITAAGTNAVMFSYRGQAGLHLCPRNKSTWILAYYCKHSAKRRDVFTLKIHKMTV